MAESRAGDDLHRFAYEAPIGIMRADAAGMCVYANPAWSALTGLNLGATMVLDDRGLPAAIDDIAEQLADFGISVRRRIDPTVEAEKPEHQIVIFRIGQEALTNVRKYADDKEPSVEIDYDDGALSIVVEDLGKGFEVGSSDRRGCGLAGMREQVRLAGGTCRVESRPGHGTRVTVRLPSSQPARPVPKLAQPAAKPGATD